MYPNIGDILVPGNVPISKANDNSPGLAFVPYSPALFLEISRRLQNIEKKLLI